MCSLSVIKNTGNPRMFSWLSIAGVTNPKEEFNSILEQSNSSPDEGIISIQLIVT